MATRRQHPDDPSFARLTVTAVGLEFGLPNLTLEQDRKVRATKQDIFARQVAAYLCQTVFDMSIPRVSELFARDRSTIVHALSVVEESRDDSVFNRKLIKAEAFLNDSLQTFRGAA